MGKLPRLNIGAGRTPRTGYHLNCDLYPGDNIDVVFDASKPWPFPDSSIGSVECHHVFEHLPDVWTFMREAHRVLHPSGVPNLTIRLPYGPGLGGVGDITHLRQYVPHSFCCFQPGYGDWVSNPQHHDWPAPFSVMSLYLRINPRLRWLVKPGIRYWGLGAVDFLWDGYIEMTVGLRALKTLGDVERWKKLYTADQIPVAPYMYEHEYHNRVLPEGQNSRLLFFGPSRKALQAMSDQERGLK